MNEEESKEIAKQLRQPQGELAIQVGERMNQSNASMNLATIEALHVNPNDTILEIGIGNGFFVKNILSADRSIRYTGCDFSEKMISEASLCNAQFIKDGQAHFYLANVENLPFEKESFDKIFTINTLYFWEDIERVFSEIRRVLRPNGQFFISIRPKSLMDKFSITKFGFKTYSKQDLEALMLLNGFINITVIEKEEAPRLFFGEKMKDEFLIVSARV